MKIVKHVDSELYAGLNEVAGETCQGLLTGLFIFLLTCYSIFAELIFYFFSLQV